MHGVPQRKGLLVHCADEVGARSGAGRAPRARPTKPMQRAPGRLTEGPQLQVFVAGLHAWLAQLPLSLQGALGGQVGLHPGT